MVSPGRIFRRNRTLLMPRNRGTFPAYRSMDSSRISADWAMHSTEYTPGSTGSPGKWPRKISRSGSMKKVVTMWSPGTISSTVSTSSMGSRWGMMVLISSLESFMAGSSLPCRTSGAAGIVSPAPRLFPFYCTAPGPKCKADFFGWGMGRRFPRTQKRAARVGGSPVAWDGCFYFAALAALMASISSGVTLNRSPQMP